jgi:hypothetical protein
MLRALTFGPTRKRRRLASAFVGEIAGIMSIIEESVHVRQLELAIQAAHGAPIEVAELNLPRLSVYEANACELGVFESPLPRQLAYFYTRLAAAPHRLRSLSLSSYRSVEERDQRAREVLAEITQILKLGEELLRSLRQFVSVKRPSSISRA